MGDFGRASRPHRSLLLGPARLSGACRVRSAACSLESQTAWRAYPMRLGERELRHRQDGALTGDHCAGEGLDRPPKEARAVGCGVTKTALLACGPCG